MNEAIRVGDAIARVMRFYRMPLSEVFELTVRQLYFLGGRIHVYQAEDALSAIEAASFAHMKEESRREIIARNRAIIDEDNLRAGVSRETDRDGMARLKDAVRRTRKR